MTWAATAITIAFELLLALTFFLPFIEWPRLIRRIRLAHLAIGGLLSYALYSPDEISISESIVYGLIWLTFTLTVAFT